MKLSRFALLLLALALTGLTSLAQKNWSWSNMLPASVTWKQVAFGNGLYVAVGADATIASSPDGASWTIRRMSTAGMTLNGVAYGDGRFVAVGMGTPTSISAGLLMTSTDGVTWTTNDTVASTLNAQFAGVTHGNGLWVVAGASQNRVLTSPDGLVWTTRNAGFNTSAVAFGGGRFVLTSGGNRAISSTDGITWTNNFLVGDANTFTVAYEGITYGAGKFVIAGRDASFTASTYTSADGLAWTLSPTVANGANGVQWVGFANNTFVMAGSAGIFSSPDGASWTKRTSAMPTTRSSTPGSVGPENFSGVSGANNTLFAVGAYGSITTSTDGTTWTRRSTGTAHDLNGMVHDGNRFVITGTGGTVVTSPDGTTWTAASTNQTGWFGSLAFGAGRYVTAGLSGAFQSSDLATWTSIGGSGTNQMFGVIFANNRFIAAPNSIALGLRVSADGTTWTNATIAGSSGQTAYGLAGGNNTFVLTSGGFGSATPKIYSSPDGTTWTDRTPTGFTAPNSLAYGNGRYVLLTNSHSWTSTDGASWTSTALSGFGSLTRVKYVDTKFVARSPGTTGGSAVYRSSADGITWADIGNSVSPNQNFEELLARNGKVYGVGAYGMILVGDLDGATAPSPTPQSQAVAAGASATLSTTATGTIQWSRNGTTVAGATTGSLAVTNVQPASAGIYTAAITNGTTTTLQSAILGVASTAKIIGNGSEVGANITHPNGNVYDQALLDGPAATITADSGQITRTSYIDLSNDIVQVEFSGAGTLTLVLDSPTGPAFPASYNQSVNYMKGHVGIVITGANETSNVSVFSVGRGTAVNQALFRDEVTYDGFADIAFIAIQSTNGKFGGVRTANASYWNNKGFTGVYAPGVQFLGPVFVGDINAQDTATPVLLLGSVTDARITGGDLLQANGRALEVSGLTQLNFTAGTTSHNLLLAAQVNRGVLQQNGVNVTSQIVVNPTP